MRISVCSTLRASTGRNCISLYRLSRGPISTAAIQFTAGVNIKIVITFPSDTVASQVTATFCDRRIGWRFQGRSRRETKSIPRIRTINYARCLPFSSRSFFFSWSRAKARPTGPPVAYVYLVGVLVLERRFTLYLFTRRATRNSRHSSSYASSISWEKRNRPIGIVLGSLVRPLTGYVIWRGLEYKIPFKNRSRRPVCNLRERFFQYSCRYEVARWIFPYIFGVDVFTKLSYFSISMSRQLFNKIL